MSRRFQPLNDSPISSPRVSPSRLAYQSNPLSESPDYAHQNYRHNHAHPHVQQQSLPGSPKYLHPLSQPSFNFQPAPQSPSPSPSSCYQQPAPMSNMPSHLAYGQLPSHHTAYTMGGGVPHGVYTRHPASSAPTPASYLSPPSPQAPPLSPIFDRLNAGISQSQRSRSPSLPSIQHHRIQVC